MGKNGEASKQKNLGDFAYVSLLSLWSICLMALWLFTATGPEQPLTQLRGQRVMIADFVNYYQTGCMTLREASHRVYDPAVQMYWTNRLIAPLQINEPQPIQYVPYIFPLMAPFALMQMNTAYIVWGVFSLCFGILGLSITWSVSHFKPPLLLCFVAGVLACCPSFIALRAGQFSWILLGLLSIYAFAFLKKHDWLAGMMLALSTIKPQYLPCLAFPALARMRIKLLCAAAITEICLLTLAGQSIGWNNVLNYPKVVLIADQQFGSIMPSMVCYRGVLGNFLSVAMSFRLSLLILLVVLATGLFLLWRYRNHGDSDIDRWLLAVSFPAAIVLSPDTYTYDCLILAVPAALTLTYLSPFSALAISPRALRIWSLLFILLPVLSWLNFPVFVQSRNSQFASYIITFITSAALAAGIAVLCGILGKNLPGTQKTTDSA